jgi:hypothetical protein
MQFVPGLFAIHSSSPASLPHDANQTPLLQPSYYVLLQHTTIRYYDIIHPAAIKHYYDPDDAIVITDASYSIMQIMMTFFEYPNFA